MKKLLAILLAAMMVFALAACGDNETPSGSENNPGTSQSGENNDGGEENNNGATQKADGAQMASDAKLNAEDAPAVGESYLTGIGKPVGYTVKGTEASGLMTGVKFIPDSGSIASGDVEKYAAAIWNLCIDQVDNGTLGDYDVGDSDGEVYSTLADAKKSDDKYTWHYNISGKRIQATIYIEDGMIILGFSDWSSHIGD